MLPAAPPVLITSSEREGLEERVCRWWKGGRSVGARNHCADSGGGELLLFGNGKVSISMVVESLGEMTRT